MPKKIESPTPDPASEAAKARGSQLLAEGKTVAERAHGAMHKLIAWHKRSREFSGPASKHPDLIPYIRMLDLRGTFPADVEQYLRDTYGAATTPGIPGAGGGLRSPTPTAAASRAPRPCPRRVSDATLSFDPSGSAAGDLRQGPRLRGRAS